MSVNAIDNSQVLNLEAQLLPDVDFVPAISYSYNSADSSIQVMDESAVDAGDTWLKAHVQIFDNFGNVVQIEIVATETETPSSATSGNLDSLNVSEGLTITATVLTVNGSRSNGSACINGTGSGVLGNWTLF